MKKYDFLVVGAGIFGISTALELRKAGHSVCVLNPTLEPDPLAAGTDISKVIRMEYGSDEEYLEMTRESMKTWREWNELFGETFYHEGFYLLLSAQALDSDEDTYEKVSYQNVIKRGLPLEKIGYEEFKTRFPAYNPEAFKEGCFNKEGGYVESGRIVHRLNLYAHEIGIEVIAEAAESILIENSQAVGAKTVKGNTIYAAHTIVCAGNFTPYLLPDLKPYMKITGHPVFHLKPSNPELYETERFPVFAADIANTGWYGFPLHPREKVVKVAKHGLGLELDPAKDKREVYESDIAELREFLSATFPDLAKAPIVYTRRCCYTDTLDGHFWIDQHPEINGLSVGSGGSGHGMKMGPVVGQIIAAVAQGNDHKWAARYRWRDLNEATSQMEEARYLLKRSLLEKGK